MDKKKTKIQNRYGFGSNFTFMWLTHWRFDKLFIALLVVQIPMNVGAALLGLLLPKIVLDGLVQSKSLSFLLAQIGVLALLFALLRAGDTKAKVTLDERAWKFFFLFGYTQVNTKRMSMDYEVYSSPKGKNAAQKAMRAVSGYTFSSLVSFFINFKNLTMNLLGFVSFATILATLNPLIIVFLLLSNAVSAVIGLLIERWRHELREKEAELWRKSRYFSQRTSLSQFAKDIRIYSLSGWLQALREALLKEELRFNEKQERRTFVQLLLQGLLVFVRDGLAYAYLIYCMFTNSTMSIGLFAVYLGAIAGFGGWLSELVEYGQELAESNHLVTDYRNFMDMEPVNSYKEQSEHYLSPPHSIRLEHISYSYPESDKIILDDICLEIKAGENLAVVGINGAGKSTLVKLICGLLHPVAGEIFIDGINIKRFNRDEHFNRFSTVFQDVCIMPVSVAQNITFQHELSQDDEWRLWNALKQADFADCVRALPKGPHSMMLKQFHKDGVDFSGGELQKLLLARAIYKDAPILILDEPTAALDPIAENELYLKYNTLTQGKTSVYISHRLSSTIFCDRIVVLENAKIVESGTHAQLIAQGGIYSRMFEVSSQYYQEEEQADV